jgi:ectoine hydroxylase-related dioxygenase (phytanoyl-CoA dioxygenase family)
MNAPGVFMPDARDLIYVDFTPERELESCNHLLDDHDALIRFYEDNGYILLREVLEPKSVERARDEVLAVIARHGIVEPGDPAGTWTGKDVPYGFEWDPEFAGIARRMIEQPDNIIVMEKLLGEAPCMVPNVQYRTYAPGGMVTKVHQDGHAAPGVADYKPVWTPLTPCPKEMGGVVLAVGQNKRGSLHNIAKPTPFFIPAELIPEDSWATTDYMPGDVLILHGFTPHGSLPNTTDRVRVSIDARVQSAAHPTAFDGTVTAVTPTSITVDTEFAGPLTFRVDEDTYIHVGEPGMRQPFEKLTQLVQRGSNLLVVRDGDYATMLRRATG